MYRKLLNVVALAGLATVPAQAQETVELIFNAHLPPSAVGQRVTVHEFAEAIEEESGGEIKVTVPGASLAPSSRTLDMVIEGVADLAFIASDDLRQSVVLPRLAELPFNSQTSEGASTALWELYNSEFSAFDEFSGVKLLAMYVLPGRNFMSFDQPIESLDDVRDLKIWVSGGELTEAVNALGAVAVNSEFGQLYEFASRGTVDAIVLSPASARSARVDEFVSSVTEIEGGLGSIAFYVFINQDIWDGLAPEHQAAIERAADNLSRRAGIEIDRSEIAALEYMNLEPSPASAEFEAEVRALIAHQEESWVEAARAAGLEDPEAIMAAYRARMLEVPAEAE